MRGPGRRVDDDAEEEVGGEERPEEHHLGDDEEEDAERLTVDPRARVGLGRAVVLAVAVLEGDRRALHHSSSSLGDRGGNGRGGPADLEVLDRLVGDLPEPDQVLVEPARLLAGEGRDQHLVDPIVLDRVLDGVEGIGAHRLPGGVDVGPVELRHSRGERGDDLLLGDVVVRGQMIV